MLEDYPARAFGGQWRAPWWGIRTPGWHLWARRKNGAWVYSLHNLRTDPWERINLKSRKPKKFRELRALYPYPL